MRHLSPDLPRAIIISGSISVLAVLIVALARTLVFPDSVEPYTWAITAHANAPTRDGAIAGLLAPQLRATNFLEANGFGRSSISIAAPAVYHWQNPDGGTPWEAMQNIGVPAHSYARFARLSNRLAVYQNGRSDLTWTFPEIPFAVFAETVFALTVILLCLSAMTLGKRVPNDPRPPRGMQPAAVLIQTFVLAMLALASLVEVRILFLPGPSVLEALFAIGLVSIATWLYQTRPWWQENNFLRAAFKGYIAAAVVTLGIGIYAAFFVPMT